MRSLCLFALCFTLPVAVNAQNYVAYNRLPVVALQGGDFEVIELRGEGARGIWCAAASFALDRVGMARNQRIYVKTARGASVSTPGRKGVVFTQDVDRLSQLPSTSYSVSVRQVGLGLPVNHAVQFCKDYQIEPGDVS